MVRGLSFFTGPSRATIRGMMQRTMTVVAALALTACGDDSTKTDTGTSGATTSGAATPAGSTDATPTPITASHGASSSMSSSSTGGSSSTGDDPDTGTTGPGEVKEPSVCDDNPPDAPEVPAGLSLEMTYDGLETRTQGIFAISWWPQHDHDAEVGDMFAALEDVRCRSINDLAMQDPPNPGAGVYYNVYLFHGGDPVPGGWALGQGTNQWGMPFLTVPDGQQYNPSNMNHEGFHIFQYASDSPGYDYWGDAAWFTEAAAQWYAAWVDPTAVNAFVEAATIDANPQLTMWHTYTNGIPQDSTAWYYGVRPYGMHTWLYYLTDYTDAPADIVTSGFYGGIEASPQRYLFEQLGGDVLGRYFVDWAAHNTADFDYLTPEQVERARNEGANYGNPADLHPYVATLDDGGVSGVWHEPDPYLAPRGWAYNVVRIRNNAAASYTFLLEGDNNGSEGAPARFDGRLVVEHDDGTAEFIEVDMQSATDGQAGAVVAASDPYVYLVVAAVPEHFSGNQTYGYRYAINRK